ncbi:MAG: hypothetical protein KAU90_05635 [Sulfurovaceae bacterium]|nr:hypothetical protein [Sulfurovaceae bacterium]
MKKFIILLIFNSIYTIANNQILEDNCTNCKAILFNRKIDNTVTTVLNLPTKDIEAILENSLKEIRLYKKEKNSEIKKLNNRLENIIKEFTEYKIKKNREIRRLKSELAIYKKNFSENQQELTNTKTYESKPIKWVEVVVEDDIDIFQLALEYYGDRNKYKQIYLTNKDIIGNDLQIVNGMSLKIPITEDFREQPMFLNRD